MTEQGSWDLSKLTIDSSKTMLRFEVNDIIENQYLKAILSTCFFFNRNVIIKYIEMYKNAQIEIILFSQTGKVHIKMPYPFCEL